MHTLHIDKMPYLNHNYFNASSMNDPAD
jgi:hypothetical protein